MMVSNNSLDDKIRKTFPDESVFKTPNIYNIFSGRILPSFIKDWLIKKFTTNGHLDENGLLSFLKDYIVVKDNDIKNRLTNHSEQKKLLTKFDIDIDIKNDVNHFSILDLGIKRDEGIVPKHIITKFNLKSGENWGIITLEHRPPEDGQKGAIEIVDFKQFKPYKVDLDNFRNTRNKYSIEEWINLLIRAMEYNPNGFDSIDQKLLFLSRLLVFVEPNLNMVELAPKGTGKSYIFGNMSKYGYSISGGSVTRAKLFYDVSKSSEGMITKYDFLAMDEVQTITFGDVDEIRGALKSYLESGVCTVANRKLTSSSGLILLGNIELDDKNKPYSNRYLAGLPPVFHESALIDRFHGFIEGWKLPRINESLILSGYTLNVEYFSEIMHSLRETPDYAFIVNELLNIPEKADTRDKKAIIRLATGYLKLLFPNVRKPNDISKADFLTYCLNPAKQKRGIIRKQLHLMDPEYKEEIPDISLK